MVSQKFRSISLTRVGITELLDPIIKILSSTSVVLKSSRDNIEMILRGALLLPRSQKFRVGRNTQFIGASSNFSFGKNICIYGNTYMNASGDQGQIKVGDNTHIDQFCVLYGQGRLEIGLNCAISSGVIIYTQSNSDVMKDGTPVVKQPTVYSPVIIEDGCWLGAGCRILPGVTIGSGATIGAGAVVLDDVKPGSTVVGVPAKLVNRK